MIVYSINKYIQENNDIITLCGKTPVINPMIGYDEDVSPILLYTYNPNIKSEDSYYIKHDIIKYVVLDTDASRGFAIRNKIIELLNRADLIQTDDIEKTYGRLLYMNLFRSDDRAPLQTEGYYQIISYFEFCWVPID